LCGGVAFEMTGTPKRVYHCHCTRCRKTRGTSHATNLLIAIDGVRFLRGEDLVKVWKAPDAKFFTHAFCSDCGSTMPRLDQTRGFAIVPLGSFDDDPIVRPQAHIFVDSKAVWDTIADDLPQIPDAPSF
jgi:hypothetical protein